MQAMDTPPILPPDHTGTVYDPSPVVALYLRIMQYQYISQTNHILSINAM